MSTEPRIELVPVPVAGKGVLRELLNLYLYDLADLVDADPNEHGRFEYPYLDVYWTEPRRHAFLISRDGALAGFVMVNAHTASGAARGIAEFFVLRRHRRAGVGRAAATSTFARFPGSWEVVTDRENAGAAAFWRATIAAGGFTHLVEHPQGIGAWTGPSWTFDVPAPPDAVSGIESP